MVNSEISHAIKITKVWLHH